MREMDIKITKKGTGLKECDYSPRSDYIINAAAEELVESLDQIVQGDHDFRTTDSGWTTVYRTERVKGETRDVSLYDVEIVRKRNTTYVEFLPLNDEAKKYLRKIMKFYAEED